MPFKIFPNFFDVSVTYIIFFWSDFHFVETAVYYYYLMVNIKSFNTKENVLISLCIPFIRENIEDQSLFNSVFYYYIINPEGKWMIGQLFELVAMFRIDVSRVLIDYLLYFLFYYKLFVFWIIMIILLFIVQLSIFRCNKNWKRKAIHFFMLPCISNMNYFTRYNLDIIILLNVFLSVNFKRSALFKHFTSSKDHGNIPVSNVLILCSTYYPYYFLEKCEDFIALLITVFMLDSMASIIGTYLEKKDKSVQGMLSGVLSAIVLHYLLFRNFNYVFYYFMMGIVEYIVSCNDNLILPLISVLFFKFQSS
ncbi:hypothetical protein VCUG_00944 [Vavraia culicis subsp. floridensis]|uniref:Dolichol kinase n=1 Tax=Vavraia culicis (isolate floridensis) TaxID=948595 RepID=L2GVC6_VAVCU|nr:uncharacterized protein VCUG_00944 [Vavraia culicis subsp. floridensis]ELA47621.1 hypothetical protein VCUG_00944 [Vavraia culicis subsp. floridensis]